MKNYNIYLSILLLLLILFVLASKKVKEPYIFSECKSNQNIPNINDTSFKESNGIYKSSNGEFFNFFITENTSNENRNKILSSPSSSNPYASISDVVSDAPNYTEKDFFIFKDGNASYYKFNQSQSDNPTINEILYISNSTDNIKRYTFLGKGGLTNNGYNKLKQNSFKYLAEANKYCNDEYIINDKMKTLIQCLDDPNKSPSEKTACITAAGIDNSLISSFGTVIDRDYNIDPNLQENSYINSFSDGISNNINDVIQDIELEDLKNNIDIAKETKLDYNSNFLIYLAAIIIFVITIIILVLAMLNNSMISSEFIIGYVIFVVLVIFTGSKYFSYVKQDVTTFVKPA